MRRKLELLSKRRIRQAPQAVASEVDTSQYDLTLRRVKLKLNRTAAGQQTVFCRVRSSGNMYLYSDNHILRIIVSESGVKLASIATISDINEEVVEFEMEELKTVTNKRLLVGVVYLRDRFHIYQIPENAKNDGSTTIKASQKINRPGHIQRSVLVQHKSDLFLISGYSEAGFGKVVIYRWVDYHFSLRDVKEVSRCDELLVFSGDQLVMLVLEFAKYPERSVNNIYMLNDQFKLIKTQEMYFLFDRLPHYKVDNQFYIMRCLALDSCFLYRWNGESLFRRVSKIGLDPRNIDIMTSDYDMAVMSHGRTLYFYNNQPLLKIAASYVVIGKRGTAIDTPFPLDPKVGNLFLYKEETTGKLYLCILYNSGPKMLDMVEMQLNKARSMPSAGEQSNFNALKTCLFHIKDLVNIRKKWIDLLKYQLSKTVRTCKSKGQLLSASQVFLAESNKVNQIEVGGIIETSPQGLLTDWSSSKSSLAALHAQSQDLFYLNRMNTVQSNMKIQGNLRTKSTRMKHVKVHNQQRGPVHVRPRRDLQSSKVITSAIVNAREVLYSGPMFAYTMSRSNINYVSSPVHIGNLYTTRVHVSTNAINRIQIDHMLYNATDKFVEQGHKVFSAMDLTAFKVYSVNGVKAAPRFTSLRKFVVSTGAGVPVKLSGTRGVTNLIVSGTFNNVLLSDLLNQLYYVDKKQIINGNVFLRSPSYIRNVHARHLNSFPVNHFFDLRTNQTISAVVHLSQVYARSLHSKTINGINIPRDVALISSTKNINSALASNFVVMKDLTLSAEDQHFTKHVLGTKVEDFSQIYSGRVHLKGTLKLKKLNMENQKDPLILKGLTASPDVQRYFWMKHVQQDIGTFTFNRNVETSHLLCAELNYNPTNNYLRGDQWPSHLNLEMSNVYVQGFVKTYATVPSFLQYIYSEAVQRGSMSTVSGRKVFTGQLQTDTLVADVVDSINIQSLISDASPLAFHDGVKEIGYLSVEECYIELLGGMTLMEFHNISFASIIDNSVNTHNAQQLEYLFLPDVKAEHFRISLINGVNAENFISEIDSFTYRVDPFAKQLKIDNLVVKKNVISTSQMFMDYLNNIGVKEYFKLLTLKGEGDHMKQWEIGGCKTLQKGMTVDETMSLLHMNSIILDNVLYNSARKTANQNIVGLWSIGQLGAKYLATKQINDIPTKHLQNSNLKTFKLKHDISIGTLSVSDAQGHMFPNSSSCSMPPNLQVIASLTVHGSLLLQHWTPGTLLYDAMLSAVTGNTEVFEKKIVFNGNSVEILKMWNEGNIFSKSCNFMSLLNDSVMKKQPKLIFHTHGKAFKEVICSGSVTSNDLVTASLVNGIDVVRLNQSIHSVGHHQEMIKSYKYFEEVKVVQLLCSDQLTDGIYPHHLDLHSEESQTIRKRYQFDNTIEVIGNLYVEAINDFSLQHFLATRVVKNRTYAQEYHQEKSQQVTGLIQFSNLVLSGEHNTAHIVNGIPVSEIVSRSSNEHQIMVEPKHVKGTVHLLGPTSIMKCNKVNLLDAYKSSFMINAAEMVFKELVFANEGSLQHGLTIENRLNGVSVHKMMKLRLSSVEDLLPLIPVIREQLSISSRAYVANSAKESRLLYIENIPFDESSVMTQSSRTKQFKANGTIDFEKSCTEGVNRFNVTVRQNTPDGETSSVRATVDGMLLRSEFKEIANNGELQTLVVSQVEKDSTLVLLLYVSKNGVLSVQQELPLSTSGASFHLIHVNDSALLLSVSDSHQLQLGTLAPNLKLFYYDPVSLRFVHFKTFSGSYTDVVAIDVDGLIMFALSEESSTMVEIFIMDRSYSSLYQKLIFDSPVASMKAYTLQGNPALQIATVDNLVYVYGHSILEGWRQLSYGRISSFVN